MRLLLTLTLALFTTWSLAADLSTKEVEQWLQSAPELQSWLEKQEDKLEQASGLDDNLSDEDLLLQTVQQLKKVGIHDDLNKKVKAAGFADVMHWLKASQQISLAYMALVMEEQLGQRAELEDQLKQLEVAQLPEESKEMMRAMLQSSLAMLDAIAAVSDADKAAVQPYLEQLTQQVGDY